MILALDLGSTSWKAALYTPEGRCEGLSRMPTPTKPEGAYACFPRDGLRESLRQLLSGLRGLSEVTAVSLTGMAESGGFVSRKSGEMLTPSAHGMTDDPWQCLTVSGPPLLLQNVAGKPACP